MYIYIYIHFFTAPASNGSPTAVCRGSSGRRTPSVGPPSVAAVSSAGRERGREGRREATKEGRRETTQLSGLSA